MSDPAQSSTENPRSRTYKGLRQLGRFVIHAPCGGHSRPTARCPTFRSRRAGSGRTASHPCSTAPVTPSSACSSGNPWHVCRSRRALPERLMSRASWGENPHPGGWLQSPLRRSHTCPNGRVYGLCASAWPVGPWCPSPAWAELYMRRSPARRLERTSMWNARLPLRCSRQLSKTHGLIQRRRRWFDAPALLKRKG